MLVLYPTAMIVLWMPTYLIRLLETLQYAPESLPGLGFLAEFSMCLISLEGFFNSLLYGFDLRRLFGSSRPKKHDTGYSIYEEQDGPQPGEEYYHSYQSN